MPSNPTRSAGAAPTPPAGRNDAKTAANAHRAPPGAAGTLDDPGNNGQQYANGRIRAAVHGAQACAKATRRSESKISYPRVWEASLQRDPPSGESVTGGDADGAAEPPPVFAASATRARRSEAGERTDFSSVYESKWTAKGKPDASGRKRRAGCVNANARRSTAGSGGAAYENRRSTVPEARAPTRVDWTRAKRTSGRTVAPAANRRRRPPGKGMTSPPVRAGRPRRG